VTDFLGVILSSLDVVGGMVAVLVIVDVAGVGGCTEKLKLSLLAALVDLGGGSLANDVVVVILKVGNEDVVAGGCWRAVNAFTVDDVDSSVSSSPNILLALR